MKVLEDILQKKIDRNRELINDILLSDEDPGIKHFLITKLSKSNEKLIEQLNS